MILVYQSTMFPSSDFLFRAVNRLEMVVGTDQRLSVCGFLARRIRLSREKPYPVVRVDVPRGYGRKFFWLARPRLRVVKKWCENRFGERVRVAVFTIPHLAPLAQDFRDATRVYYVCDNFKGYDGWGEGFVDRREREMVKYMDHIFCVSNRIRCRFIEEYGLEEKRIHLSPNATVSEWVPQSPLKSAADLPPEVKHISRPVAGIVGTMGENTDFALLIEVAKRTPWLRWLLVGPMLPIENEEQANSRLRFLGMQQIRYIGARPYEYLGRIVRSLDVAIMPYRKREPTFSGSSVRLFDHLAAGRPIIATRGCAQCEEYAAVLHLVDTPDDMCAVLTRLRDSNFDDGLCEARWKMSLENTWDRRASEMLARLEQTVKRL